MPQKNSVDMNRAHQITRSNVNSSNVAANQYPKSGFNLTHNSHISAILGRLHPVSHQWLMPSDKFSGSTTGTLTFNQISTPIVSDMYTSMHHFYMPFRSVDTDFEEHITPTKLNDMGSNYTFPSFSLRDIANMLMNQYFITPYNFHTYNSQTGTRTGWLTGTAYTAMMDSHIGSLTATGGFWPMKTKLAKVYLDDALDDLSDQLEFIRVSTNQWDAFTDSEKLDHVYQILAAECDFFFGENSLLDFLGYQILDHATLRRLLDDWASKSYPNTGFSTLSNVKQLEYPLRIYYAIWYEYYRDVNLEPATTDPRTLYRKWNSTPRIGISTASDELQGLWLLITRIRSWEKDMFTTAEIDDISRHVFAPVFGDSSATPAENNVQSNRTYIGNFDVDAKDYENAEAFNMHNVFSRGMVTQRLTYRDINGVSQTLAVPLPSGILDSVSGTTYGTAGTGYKLDLLQLRNAKMLESYLKRNYYFGDEYKDRMFAHYNSRVSDLRVNRPEYLGGSYDNAAFEQKVNSTPTSEAPAGERTAVGGVSLTGDGFTFFAEEFGMYMGLLSVMPRAQYNPLTPQLLMQRTMDFPVPAFAMQNDECGRTLELFRDGDADVSSQFGHYPYAHAWRSRVDEVHGEFISSRRHYTFARFWTTDTPPVLNYRFLHCRPNLGMFQNRVLLDGQCYGTIKNNFFVERVLPTPVEII